MSDNCNKNKNCSCGKEPLQTCFGKRSDALYCYNDDKAKICPSNWHPVNRNLIYLGASCTCQENVTFDIPATTRLSTTRLSTTRLSTTRLSPSQQQFATSSQQNQCCMQSLPPPPPRKKLSRELMDIRDYLRNCMYQRLNVNWTNEDDIILIKCIYKNLTKVRSPSRVCPMLDEILQRSKNALLNDFVMRVREEFAKNGHCDPLPVQCSSTCVQQPQATYQQGQQQPVPQTQLLADTSKGQPKWKTNCVCDSKSNLRMKGSYIEGERATGPRSSLNRRKHESGGSDAFPQSKIRKSSDDDSDGEPTKTNVHRKKCHCRIK